MMRIVMVQYGADDGAHSDGAADDAYCDNNDDDANDDSCGEKGDKCRLSVSIHSLHHSVVRTL
jgi:hypothetical protein